MRKQNKKGFTIVELVIVIAVIAILVAVMVPTFVSLVKKAQVSNDKQLVKNLNTALKAESVTEKPATMTRALEIASDYGYDVAKIKAKAPSNNILWDSVNNVFCYLEDGNTKPTYIPDYPEATTPNKVDCWVIDSTPDANYSTYLYNYTGDGEIAVSTGIDVGNENISSIIYDTTATQTVTIRTNSDQCTLTINAGNSDVNFYGFAQTINVNEVKASSLHIFGGVADLKVTAGHVAVEETGIVFTVSVLDTSTNDTKKAGSITNKGYIGATAADEIKTAIETAEGSKKIGGALEIGTLAQLESFRDTVNAGKDFADKTVKLTADIKLNDGWKPIGEGYRQIVDKQTDTAGDSTFFKGTFDGQNHTISNLNNNGFVPTRGRFDPDDGYAYGLFALIGNGAKIQNLTLDNVNIDINDGDSVAALVGYSEGAVEITNITVKGTIRAKNGVAGIVGRAYIPRGEQANPITYTVKITDCSNYAKITATESKAAGIVSIFSDISSKENKPAYNSYDLTVSGSNYGDLSSGDTYKGDIVAMKTNNRSKYIVTNKLTNAEESLNKLPSNS